MQRLNSCGSWLPEDKKLIYGIDGKKVEVHAQLLPPRSPSFEDKL